MVLDFEGTRFGVGVEGTASKPFVWRALTCGGFHFCR